MINRLIQCPLWLSALGVFLLGYAILLEPSRLVVRHIDFVSDKYSGPDIRIGLVSDIHINSAHVPASRVSDIVARLNEEAPDLILMPGDFVAGHDKSIDRTDEFNESIKRGVSNLAELSAPTFATIGNHDVWWDAGRMADYLKGAGVEVLNNQTANINGLCIVGLADYWTGTPERSTYTGCAQGSVILVITHSPDAWQSFRDDTILAFAGHTHGGQVNLPIIGRRVNATSLGSEHSYGFSKIGGVDLFVSAGVGTSILPIRFRAPPEIVIITLRAQSQEAIDPDHQDRMRVLYQAHSEHLYLPWS